MNFKNIKILSKRDTWTTEEILLVKLFILPELCTAIELACEQIKQDYNEVFELDYLYVPDYWLSAAEGKTWRYKNVNNN